MSDLNYGYPAAGVKFQHRRTGAARNYSGPEDLREVAKVMGKGAKPGTFFVLDKNGATFYIMQQPDGSWWEA